jgi:hypothetical protein
MLTNAAFTLGMVDLRSRPAAADTLVDGCRCCCVATSRRRCGGDRLRGWGFWPFMVTSMLLDSATFYTGAVDAWLDALKAISSAAEGCSPRGRWCSAHDAGS